ncbi:MAG: MFS transporter [Actinomycetota bacterium]
MTEGGVDPGNLGDLGDGVRVGVLFGWVSLLQDLGSKMVVPLVPLFLVIGLDASPLAVGVVDGVSTLMVALVAPLAGRLARPQRAVGLVRAGYAVSSIAKVALAAAMAWPAVLAVRAFDRVGKGLRDPPRDLLLTAVSVERRGRVFGLQQAMDKVGGAAGPLVGLALYEMSGESFRTVFLVAGIPCMVSVALLVWIPQRPRRAIEGAVDRLGAVGRSEPSSAPRPRRSVPFTPAQRRVLIFLGLVSVLTVPTALVIVRAAGLGDDVATILAAFAGMRAATALVAVPSGSAIDRWGPRRVVAFGYAVAAVGLAVAAAAPGSGWVLIALPILGAADGALRSGIKLWLVGLGSADNRGRVLGDWGSLSSATGFVAAITMGALWGGDGQLPLAVATLASALAAAVLVGSSLGAPSGSGRTQPLASRRS